MAHVTVVVGSLRESERHQGGRCGMVGAGWTLNSECQAGLSLPTFSSCICGKYPV